MRILSAQVQNFGSYELLLFVFADQGLTLLSGPTGAGKSTLCDIIPWVLYGKTAKNGAVDEVRSWGSKETTVGEVRLVTEGYEITVVRTRGPNDLFYTINGKSETRGKDLADTQRILNELLGADADLYLAASYYHEFSQTASFFTATAKVRRVITENLVDLSLATKLSEQASEDKKLLKTALQEEKQNLSVLRERLSGLDKQATAEAAKEERWDAQQAERTAKVRRQYANFEQDRTKRLYDLTYEHTLTAENLKSEINEIQGEIHAAIDSLSDGRAAIDRARAEATPMEPCPTCGAIDRDHAANHLNAEERRLDILDSQRAQKISVLKSLKTRLDRHLANTKAMDDEAARVNTYGEQLETLLTEQNPYTKSVSDIEGKRVEVATKVDEAQTQVSDIQEHLADIETLVSVIADFRGVLIKTTVQSLENNTNKLLTDHFDAEIRVKFSVDDADTLDVLILKDGNEATFTQLSKGQRQMLKLCFAVSTMRSIATHHAISLNCIFLDEPTDGLSSDLKEKSFGLLQTLALDYQSVFVVEHHEGLKSHFTNAYHVTLVNGKSQIEKA